MTEDIGFETLSAYVDGELPKGERRRVEQVYRPFKSVFHLGHRGRPYLTMPSRLPGIIHIPSAIGCYGPL
jgi:hypothetical protein